MQFAIENKTNLSVLVGANTQPRDISTRELSVDELNWVGGGETPTSVK
jgi:hypothetical protein